mgnify:FL=1
MYQLDTRAARKADAAGAFITDIGKYIGTFKQAVDVTSKKGTKGIALAFESNDGQKANFTLYTQRADGTKIMGFEELCAVMTCMKLRGIAPKAGQYKRYDFDAKADVTEQGDVFPELIDKPIGLLLETEDYLSGNGDKRTRMVLAGIFQADTELTASEILDRQTAPAKLEKLVQRLRHRPLKNQRNDAGRPPAGHPAGDGGYGGADDDLIPF